jgi:tetratricopeptide (TPR) repeat protein
MFQLRIKISSVIFLILLTLVIYTNYSIAQNVLSPDQWKQDLQFLARELPTKHPNLFSKMSKEQFKNAVDKLEQSIPALSDKNIIIELSKIVSMVGDGHTRLTLPQDPNISFTQAHSKTPLPKDSSLILGNYPIRLYLFSDGLFIKEVTSEYANLLGAKVIKIGNVTTQQALEAVRSVVHFDNEMGFKLIAPTRLVIPEVLHSINIINNKKNAAFLLEDMKGDQFTIELDPLPLFEKVKWVDAREKSTNITPPWLKDPENYFWYEYLEDLKTIYVQYNQVSNKKEESVSSFFDKVFTLVNNQPIERFILDLRRNFGGNNGLNLPLIHGLIKSDKINQRGKLFTIIGRSTFSAAMMLSVDLEHHTNTLFVGEPTGSSPNHYGDSRKLQLPHSELTVRISSLYWQYSDPRDNRVWIEPDIAADLTFKNYETNHDPALEAIFNYKPQRSITERMLEAIEKEGVKTAITLYREFKNNPINAYKNTEDDLNNLGYKLLYDLNLVQEAITVFKLNVEEHPLSWNVYDSLGESYMVNGDKEQATQNYRKSKELNPENTNADDMIKKLENPN